jgi:hypothetical protein
MDFYIAMQGEFSDNNLTFHFINCFDYGYMLTDIYYEGRPMRKEFKQVKSGKLLEVRFDKKINEEQVRNNNCGGVNSIV